MEKRVIKRYEYELMQLLKHTEEVDIYLAKRKDRYFSFREYRVEKPYNEDLAKYKKIQKIGVNVQKLIAHDRQLLVLIFECFQEPTALDVLAKEELKEIYFKQLFTIYRFCRFSKVELNYLPNNFVLKGTTLYYIGEEITASDPSRNLENFGLRYWIYSKEASELLEEKGLPIEPKRLISEEETNKRIVLLSVTYW
ncbi:MAG: hypothetical protein RBR44_01900 [Bacilli bacterium]|nr:hypothetical protein [Bacilli bacterium]